MDSKISNAIALKYPPVALIWSDQKPEDALQFKEQKWGCIMWLAASAARGKAAVCDRRTFGCAGGGVGMGIGNEYNLTCTIFYKKIPPKRQQNLVYNGRTPKYYRTKF